MVHWYLVMTKLRKENKAKLNLERANFEVFYPTLPAKSKTAPFGNPLFPRYLFVKACLERDIDRIKFAPGVQRLVQFGTEFVPVQASVIQGLREKCTSHAVVSEPKHKPGQTFVIKSGPFQGYEGVFQERKAKDRVMVLLKLLYGETFPVELDLCCL